MSLVKKTLAGMRWTTLATVINVSFNIGFTAVMARLLTPAAFGLVAMAQIAIRFISYFAQLGVSPALVQKPSLTEKDIRAAFTVSVIVNTLLFLLMWLIAPKVSKFFDNSSIIYILRGLSSAFLFSGASVISMALLRRNLMFKKIAQVEVISYVIGYGLIGIGCAANGLGVWSLVLAVVGQELIVLVVSYTFVRHSIRPSSTWADIQYFLKYGGKYSTVGFLEYIGQNVDSLLIGRWFGESMLGVYNRAQMVVKLPMHHIGTTITKVLFPILSGAQDNLQKIANAFLVGWLLIGGLAFAISFSLIPAASDVVLTLLGPQWTSTIPIVKIAALAVPFAFLTVLSGIVCDAQGLLWPKLTIQIAALLTLSGAIYLLHDEGITGIAKAIALTEVVRLILYSGLHLHRLPITASDFIKINAAIIFISAFATLSVYFASQFALYYLTPAWLSLIIEVIAGGFSFILSFALVWLPLRALPAIVAIKKHLPIVDSIERYYPSILLKTS